MLGAVGDNTMRIVLKVKKAIREPHNIAPYLISTVKRLLSDMLETTELREINIELVNYCNLRCKWCSLDHAQKKYVMSEEILKRLFDNLASDKRFNGVKSILLWSGGETLLHPRLVDMLAIIKEYKDSFVRQGRSFPSVILLTNGVLLNKEISRKLVDLGLLDFIRFSVDGGSREKYEELRGGARWDVVDKNIIDFVAINQGKIKTGIISIIENGKDLCADWMSDEFRQLLQMVDDVELRHPHDWIGDIHVDGSQEKEFQNRCTFLFHTVVILPNGDVTVCCNDLNGKGAIGNLYKENLFQIYDSPRRREMIRNLKRGKRDKIDLCRNCRGYYQKR